MWGEGGDTEGVVEGSRGCEPQTDPTCSQNFAPPERGEPGRTPEGSQIMASPPNRGSSSRPCCSTGAHSCMHLPWFSSWLLAVIWDPFRVHLGCVAFPGVRTCEHAGSVWGSHPRLPSMTPSVSPPSPSGSIGARLIIAWFVGVGYPSTCTRNSFSRKTGTTCCRSFRSEAPS